MSQKCISAIKLMGNCILLMRLQRYFRIHSGKSQVAPVILTGTDGIKGPVINTAEKLTPLRILKDPFLEGFLYRFLFLRGEHGLLLIQDTLLLSIYLHQIINPDILQIQGIFNDLIGIHPSGPVSRGCKDIVIAVIVLSLHIPQSVHLGILDVYIAADQIIRCPEKFCHEIPVNPRRNPGRSESHIDL